MVPLGLEEEGGIRWPGPLTSQPLPLPYPAPPPHWQGWSRTKAPLLSLRLRLLELPSRSHASLAELAAKYTSCTWPGPGGPL